MSSGGARPLRLARSRPRAASTDRENLNLDWHYTPTTDDTWEVQAYGSRYHLRLWSDFTFFKRHRPALHPAAGRRDRSTPATPRCSPNANYIPGDGIEQTDTRWLFGAKSGWSAQRGPGRRRPGRREIGVETRNDDIDVSLQRQVRRSSFFTSQPHGVSEHSVSGYWGSRSFPTDWIRLEGGLRGDFFIFDVRQPPAQQGVDPNFDRSSSTAAPPTASPSPKANLVLTPLANTDVYLNFGYGFHSNDARATSSAASSPAPPARARPVVSADSRVTPLTQAIGYEIGARTRQFDRLDVAAALWLLDLDSELVFSGDAGTVEPSSAAPSATASTSSSATRSPTGCSPTTTSPGRTPASTTATSSRSRRRCS